MAATKTLLTAEEFFRLPETLNKRELVRGEIVEMSPVGGYHADVQLELGGRMRQSADERQQGRVVVELGFRLARDPDMVRGPDIAFISAARLREQPLGPGYYEGPPDLAVEVVSPGDTVTDIQDKVQAYFDAGTRRVWVANLATASVIMHYPDGTVRVLRGDDVLSGEDILPGFAVRVADLFRD